MTQGQTSRRDDKIRAERDQITSALDRADEKHDHGRQVIHAALDLLAEPTAPTSTTWC
jgi:hypothetical protein